LCFGRALANRREGAGDQVEPILRPDGACVNEDGSIGRERQLGPGAAPFLIARRAEDAWVAAVGHDVEAIGFDGGPFGENSGGGGSSDQHGSSVRDGAPLDRAKQAIDWT
jgi:hypothetical protein